MSGRLSARLGPLAAGVGLVLLCLALFLPGLRSIPVLDRDEARYAQATRQMLESGDFVDIRFQEVPRYKKPIGIHWLQAAAVGLSGWSRDDIAPYRIPSLLGAIAAVLLTAWAGAPLFGWQTGCLGAAMLASSLLLCVQARLATTDAVLLATVVAAEGAMARAYLGVPSVARRGWVLFWAAIGAGVLIKGPIILLVCGSTALALSTIDRSLSWLGRLRPLRGSVLALSIAAPWLLAIGWKTGGRFFVDSVGHEFLGKLVEGQELHAAPPGYHLLAFWLAFWPFSFLAASAASWAWARRDRPAVRLCAAWIVPSWIVFEIAATKLPHYVLPLYPPIALLAAGALREIVSVGGVRWRRASLALLAATSAGLVLAVLLASIVLERRFEPLALAGAIACSVCLLAGVRLFLVGTEGFRNSPWSAASLIAGAAVLYAAAFGVVAPRLDSFWMSRRVGALVAQVRACPETVVAAVGYHEPSLVFTLGTDTKLVGPKLAARHLAENPRCALALATAADEPDLLREMEQQSVTGVRLGEVRGLDYSIGRRMTLSLWRAASPP